MAEEVATASQDEEESYFVPMTDLMVGMLFIFIVLLMAFALTYRQAEEGLTGARDARARMLSNVERSLMDIGTKVEVFPDTGVLRLPEELLFPSGSAELYPAARDDLAFLGHYLRQILPCYATAPAGTETGQCAPDPGGRLEVVMIEGHTDDRPLRDGARFRNNWELSAARAISVFQALVREGEVLPNLKNDRGDRLIAVSGYGDNRPIADNETPEGRSKNRRIDFRFIMSTPDVRPQDAVEEALRPVR